MEFAQIPSLRPSLPKLEIGGDGWRSVLEFGGGPELGIGTGPEIEFETESVLNEEHFDFAISIDNCRAACQAVRACVRACVSVGSIWAPSFPPSAASRSASYIHHCPLRPASVPCGISARAPLGFHHQCHIQGDMRDLWGWNTFKRRMGSSGCPIHRGRIREGAGGCGACTSQLAPPTTPSRAHGAAVVGNQTAAEPSRRNSVD